jgi:hypothetical protein
MQNSKKLSCAKKWSMKILIAWHCLKKSLKIKNNLKIFQTQKPLKLKSQ